METIRESWTDERMDDLSRKVDQGFERSDAALRDLRVDMDRGFERVDVQIRELRTEMHEGLGDLNGRFDALQRTLFLAAAGVIASLIGLIATQL